MGAKPNDFPAVKYHQTSPYFKGLFNGVLMVSTSTGPVAARRSGEPGFSCAPIIIFEEQCDTRLRSSSAVVGCA